MTSRQVNFVIGISESNKAGKDNEHFENDEGNKKNEINKLEKSKIAVSRILSRAGKQVQF